MTVSPNLALAYLEAAQAQKHVTVNEALRRLDALVMLAVLDRDLASPPPSPADGERYIVAAGATGAWGGHGDDVAAWQDGAWTFIAPHPGFLAYVGDEDGLVVWDGTGWRAAGGAAITALDDLVRLGVGTAADAVNPFAAKLNNALWTARTTAEGGDGTLRCKFNKETAAATLSLLMQTAYSGRAEIGLTGDDDLRVKVSPNGTTWFEAIRVDRASGRLTFPATGGPRETLTAARTYYVRGDGSDANTGLGDTAAGAFATINAAVLAAAALDCSVHDVTIQVRDGTYTTPVVLRPMLGSGTFTIRGNAATPANVVIAVNAANAISNDAAGLWVIRDMKLTTSGSGHCISCQNGGVIRFSGLNFGPCALYHIYAAGFASVTAVGNYEVSGGAAFHIAANAFVDVNSRTITYSNSPTFSGANFLSGRGGVLVCYGAVFVNGGTVGGPRYSARDGGVIFTNGAGATFIPGSSAGSGSHFGAPPYGYYS